MYDNRVVITGLGVLSSNGIGKEVFSRMIFSGVSGIKPVSLFDTAPFKVKTAGEIADFDAARFLGPKGLRTLDRSTKLLNSAAKLALDDASLNINEENSRSAGVVIGSTLGSIKSIVDFHKEAVLEGVRYVNPALFPNTVINSPASQVSIRFNIKGFNTTLATGACSGLDAISYAVNFIKLKRAEIVLAGGVEELCLQNFLGFYKAGCLAGTAEKGVELSCPFDKRRNGVILGEGACVLVLEDYEHALRRGARIYAEIKGLAGSFEPYDEAGQATEGSGIKSAIRKSLAKAEVPVDGIDYISASANSSVAGDLREAAAISVVFGACVRKVPVAAIKSMIGECFSAGSAFQAAEAVCAIEAQMVPATVNYAEPDTECALNVPGAAFSRRVNNVLINSAGAGGCGSCAVVSKLNQ